MLKHILNLLQPVFDDPTPSNLTPSYSNTSLSFQLPTTADNNLSWLSIVKNFSNTSKTNWQPTREMILAMLHAPSPVIQQAVLDLASKNPKTFFRDPFFIEQLAKAPTLLLSHFFCANAHRFQLKPVAKNQMLLQLMAHATKAKWEEEASLLYQNIQAYCKDDLSIISLGEALLLLKHPLEYCQLLAVDILLAHKERVQLIPESIVFHILQSPYLAIQQKGLQLLCYLPVTTILNHKELLLTIAISGQKNLRALLSPIVTKVAAIAPIQAIVLVRFLLPLLLSVEKNEGSHQDILTLLTGPLANSLEHISTDTIYLLLESPYAAANNLGAILLPQINLNKESLSNVIWLADHELASVRQVAFDYCTNQVDRIRQEQVVAFRLLEARCLDSRQFAFAFFEKYFAVSDWLDALLSANYLESTVANHPKELLRIKPYLQAILTQYRTHHPIKLEVLHFLEKQGTQHKEMALLIVAMLKETMFSTTDKFAGKQLMQAIYRAFPELQLGKRLRA